MNDETGTEVMEVKQEADILVEDPLASLTQEEAVIGAKLLPILTTGIAKAADARYSQQYRVKFDAMQAANTKALTEAIEKLREAAKPLSDEEIGKLLEQEYGTFPVKLAGPVGPVEFTICELPVSAEKKLLKSLRGAIAPILKLISSDEWAKLAGAAPLERVEKIVDMVPEALDVLCTCTALCLDPRGEHDWLTPEWVADHLGLNRIVMVLTAQIQASRYRDFFSLASRLYQQSRMTRA
jgi:hypothetical protein